MQSPVAPAEGLGGGGGGGGGGSALPAFKFQPRRGSLDWRRISALDVERVARELDVAALQENIASVTFCDLGREACSRCGHPVDPALLKVLRLAQLTIEYLLHCQDCLSASVAQLEARLQASLGQQQRGQQELGRQADELKGLREESRRRRKMINTLQQLLLQTGAHSYHPCHLCDKTFMNATFLRGHLQRRHAGLADGRGGGGGRQQQQQQERPLEEALEELRAKLKDTQAELEAQREAERQRQQQEVEIMRQREMEAKKEFEEWKEKERSKFYGEIDKLKQLFWDEFKVVANQNSTLEEKLQALQSHSAMVSHLGSLRDEESEERLQQAQELQALREQMEVQKTEWKRKMKQLHRERSAERRELQEENERLRASLAQDERKMDAQAQRQLSALRAQLQEQARRLAAQEDMIQTLSARKVEGVQEPPKAVDGEEDSSEEELDETRDDPRKVLETLKQNPALLQQFRPVLEDTLQEKLQGLGIKRDARGISVETLGYLESVLRTQREQKARRFADFLTLRAKLTQEATSRMTRRGHSAAAQPDGPRGAKGQQRAPAPGQTWLKSCQPAEPPSTLTTTPTPRPRSQAASPATRATPGLRLSSTPPFSSPEEDSGEDRVQQMAPLPPRAPSRPAPPPQQALDWSDTDFSEEEEDGSGGLASSGTLVQSLVRSLQKQLEAPGKKPAGGVSVFSRPSPGPQSAATAPTATAGGGRQLSEEESELELSSLEDLSRPHSPPHASPPERGHPGPRPWGPHRVPAW
ncbi:LOW QUALITY PROTEIN: zinc finger protein DZIP1L [Dipodomys spectabilis]|uniref:LOW QUALITY PROTEIN: zinc finger protein DZIP1L n=1 Tax=Dipodomys spectabilis TaxID=105255 RepID=UPI001C538D38|nr:LOW QUALITY PROTEIN: zinc finger protein DZIP1L [Dipodomys spectabilis]